MKKNISNKKLNKEIKGEKLYKTRDGRIEALGYIIRKYIEKKHGIKINNRENVPMSMDSIIEMIETDNEFKNFALNNYNVIIYCDRRKDAEPRFYIRKITEEMANLINENINNLDNKEFQDKLFLLEDDLYEKGKEKDQQKRMEQVKNIDYKDNDILTIIPQLAEIEETTDDEHEQKQIQDTVFLAHKQSEYYKFLKIIVNKSLSLPNESYIGVYYDIPSKVIGFTEPFIIKDKDQNELATEIKKKGKELKKQLGDNKNLFVIIKSATLDLYDNSTYYTIPETNGKFIEIADNKGYIDPDFSLEFPDNIASKRFFKNNLSSIRKYDDGVDIFIKDCIQTTGFMYNTFQIYFDMKLRFLELEIKTA